MFAQAALPMHADDPSALVADVQRERIRQHCAILTWLPVAHALFVWILATTVLGELDRPGVWLWASAVIGVECARAMYGRWVRAHLTRLRLGPTRALLTLASLISGATVGVAAPLFFGALDDAHRMLLICLLCSLPSIGTIVAAGNRLQVIAYAAGILAPSIVAWSTQHPPLAVPAVGMAFVHVGVLCYAAHESTRTLTTSLMIRNERDRMLKDLKRSHAAVHASVDLARKESAARARVLAAASHDLRQPLHALSLYSAVLSSHPSPEAQKEAGQRINQLVRSLGDLLHGLLDLSRITAGEYLIARENFDLRRLVDDICTEAAPVADKRGLRLTRALASAWIASDPTAVARVVRNLLDNALKYTERGTIHVSLACDTDSVEINVSDTGRGIPTAHRARIFDAFFQGANPGRDRTQGIGLGLTIVKHLVDQLGGRLTLDTQPGLGSTFRVRLGGLVKTGTHAQSISSYATQPFGADRRVLVLDDDEHVAKGMHALISLWGFHVEIALDAAKARALVTQGGVPDLLIADLRLGGLESGQDVVRTLIARHGDFPVLFITGEVSAPSSLPVGAGEHTGPYKAVMCKPIDHEALQAVMLRLLPGRSADAPHGRNST